MFPELSDEAVNLLCEILVYGLTGAFILILLAAAVREKFPIPPEDEE